LFTIASDTLYQILAEPKLLWRKILEGRFVLAYKGRIIDKRQAATLAARDPLRLRHTPPSVPRLYEHHLVLRLTFPFLSNQSREVFI
jgi:hypothetical protein